MIGWHCFVYVGWIKGQKTYLGDWQTYCYVSYL